MYFPYLQAHRLIQLSTLLTQVTPDQYLNMTPFMDKIEERLTLKLQKLHSSA